MAIGRLIAKALLEGSGVQVRGFGTFHNKAPRAQQHVHESHRIWTSPRSEVGFVEEAHANLPGIASTQTRGLVLLADLLESDGGLNPDDASRMSAAWASDVSRELQSTGISVLRGMGTFTLANDTLQFSQDDDFPSMSDLPAIEGYSSELVADVPQAPPVVPPVLTREPETMDEHAEPEENETVASDEMASAEETPARIEDSGVRFSEQPQESEGHASGEPASEEELIESSASDPDHAEREAQKVPDPIDDADHDIEPQVEEDSTLEENPEEEHPAGASSSEDSLPIFPPPTRSRSPRRYERTDGSSSKAAIWVLAAVALIVVAALLYRFVLLDGPDEPAYAENQTEEVASASDDSLAGAGVMPDSTALASSEDPTGDAAMGGTQDTPTPANGGDPGQQRPSGTPQPEEHADELVRGMGGYTLVVGSTLNEVTARQALSQYASLALPMGVLAYESGDITRYRIAVGLYESAALADTARTRQSDQFPEGTWVLAIR